MNLVIFMNMCDFLELCWVVLVYLSMDGSFQLIYEASTTVNRQSAAGALDLREYHLVSNSHTMVPLGRVSEFGPAGSDQYVLGNLW